MRCLALWFMILKRLLAMSKARTSQKNMKRDLGEKQIVESLKDRVLTELS
jgi:hypothetical protein